MPAARDVGHAGPTRRSAPRRKPKPYTLPKTFRTETTTDRRPVPKKGPPSPQRTGRAVTPQPITRKRLAAPTQTDTTSSANRSPAQRRHDQAVVDRNVREARRRYLKRTGRGSLANLQETLNVMTQGGLRPVKVTSRKDLPGAAVEASDKYGSALGQVATRLTQHRTRPDDASAPVMKVLDQTTRPVHAIAGGARAAVRHEDISRAVVRGAELKDRHTFSDVLKEAGVKNKAVRGVAGFGLDVALDPTTYVTFGTASVAEKAAVKAARDAAERAATKGLSESQVKAAAQRAAGQVAKGAKVTVKARKKPGASAPAARTVTRKTVKKAAREVGVEAAARTPSAQGVTFRFAGREVPGVHRGTAAAARGTRKVTRKIAPARLRTLPSHARNAGRSVRPTLTPVGVDAADFATARAAARRSRAHVQNVESRAKRIALELKSKLSREDYAAVIDAIERNRLGKLPKHIRENEELRKLIHRYRSELRGTYRVARRAGVLKGSVDNPDFLGKGQTRKLEKTVKAERSEQKRQVTEAKGVVGAELKAAQRAGSVASVTPRRAEVQDLRTELRAAQAAETAAKRRHADAMARSGEARGRAQVLSENVGGAKAGRIAERRTAPIGEIHYRGGGRGVEVAADELRKHWRASEAAAARTRDVKARLAAGLHDRHAAAKAIPQRGIAETDPAYLQRLTAYAQTHDLPLLEKRATKLLKAAPTDRARGYFPRDFDARIVKQLGLTDEQVAKHAFATSGPGRTVARITPGFKRADQRRLAAVNPARVAAEQTPFSTDIPLAAMNHMKQVARQVANGEYGKELAALGRPLKPGDPVHPGEEVYKLGYKGGDFALHKSPKGVPAKPTKGGQYVALNAKLVDTLAGQAAQRVATTGAGKGFDRATGMWKRWATWSVGFHVRNLIGDLEAAYRYQPAHRMPVTTAQAGRATRRASEQAREIHPTTSAKTIKIAGKDTPVDEFLADARREGVLDTGLVGRELKDLGGQGAERARKVSGGGGKLGRATNRWMTNRENLMRLATYKAQLDKGLKPAQAAEVASRAHVDYAELSELERVFLRRVFPFYTWTARQLPEVTKSLIKTPGKAATLEKAREEVGKATTGDDELQSRSKMTQSVQRQVPFVVGKKALSWSSPSTLLGELPTTTRPGDYLEELGRFAFGMTNPLVKIPIELRANRNLTTKYEIERGRRPLVAAPSWVKHLPPDLKKQLDVNPNFTDPKTKKKGYGWRGKADYTYDQLMLGWVGQAATLAGAGRAPMAEKGDAAIGITGARIDRLNKQAVGYAQRQRDQKTLEKLQRRQGILNQRGVTVDNATPEYRRLLDQINALNKRVNPPKQKGAPAGKLPIGGAGGGGGGSGGKLPIGGAGGGGKKLLPIGGG